MAIKALVSLSPTDRQKMEKMEGVLVRRLWQLQNSINGKSLQIIGDLYQRHKVKPPPALVKKIIADFQQRQARVNAMNQKGSVRLEKE